MTLALTLYRLGTALAAPLLPALLRRRARAGKEDPARLSERLGHASTPRPSGPLVWLHGASLGESVALRQLLPLFPDANVLITTQTLSSAEVWARDLPSRTVHQFAPLDAPASAARFLDHWQPDLAVFAESEIWPNLLAGLKRRGTPAALVNARLNPSSLARWSRRPRTAREVFSAFDLILAADAPTAEGLAKVLGRSVPLLGNLKHAAAPAPDLAEAARIRAAFGTTPIICFASLHAEEADLPDSLPDAARIVVPRHPGTHPSSGLPRRSTGALPLPGPTAYLWDTFGEMATAMAAADVVVVGGSFRDGLKGHNPVEALSLRKPVFSGPHVTSFQSTYDALWQATDTGPIADLSTVASAQWTPAHDRFLAGLPDTRSLYADALEPLIAKALP